jgi:hypothetical protein
MLNRWKQERVRKRLRLKWRRMLKEKYDLPRGSTKKLWLKSVFPFLIVTVVLTLHDLYASIWGWVKKLKIY